MNRDFLIPNLTPAMARQIMRAAPTIKGFISPSIAEVAGRDLAEIEGLDDPLARDVCQFILDQNRRCVIPFDYGEVAAKQAIAASIPKDRRVLITGATTRENIAEWSKLFGEKVSEFSDTNESRCQYIDIRNMEVKSLIRHRDFTVVAKIAPEHVGYEWMGRVFKEMIIYCDMQIQYTFKLGGFSNHTSAARHAADIIFPSVVAVISSDKNLKLRGDFLLPLIGAYPGLIYPKNSKSRMVEKMAEDADFGM